MGRRACVVVLALLAAGCAGAAGGAQPKPQASDSSPAAHQRASAPRPPRRRAHPPVGVPARAVPKPALTPGAVLTTSVRRICSPGYASSVRDVSSSERRAAYRRYGLRDVPYAHELDHLVSLELGGSNALRNLWPEPYGGRWNARAKDVLENRLHALVCSGRLPLRRAQELEARDWIAAYRRFVGHATAVPAGSSRGGYYLSRYPTASTVYCAGDPARRSLSRRYLVHYARLRAALRAHPGYHLHRACGG